jgi:hypothetical protein
MDLAELEPCTSVLKVASLWILCCQTSAELAMSLAKVINIGSQVKMRGPSKERPEIPNSVGAKRYFVFSSMKDCQTLHLSGARAHEGMFEHEIVSACGYSVVIRRCYLGTRLDMAEVLNFTWILQVCWSS